MLRQRNVSNDIAVLFPAYFRWIIILMNNFPTFFHVSTILISSSVASTWLSSETISNSFTNRQSGWCVALKVSFSQFLKSVERVYLQQLKWTLWSRFQSDGYSPFVLSAIRQVLWLIIYMVVILIGTRPSRRWQKFASLGQPINEPQTLL